MVYFVSNELREIFSREMIKAEVNEGDFLKSILQVRILQGNLKVANVS